MILAEMLRDAAPLTTPPPIEITGLQYDSRKLSPGEAFFAFPGEHVDGHQLIPAARRAGAAAVVSQQPPPADDPGVWVQVQHGRRALASAALAFYGHPDRRIKLVAATGTNGKTTVVYLIDSILRAAGFTTARLGTIEHRVGDRAIPAINTTPESLDLVRYLVQLQEIDGSHCCLEASSHALDLGRIWGFHVDTAIFTNLSQDHLDLHGDMAAYARAKRRLFEGAGAPPPRTAVINADDATGREFLQLGGFEAIAYAIDRPADVTAAEIQADYEGLRFTAKTPQGDLPVRSHMHGRFNVSNLLAAIGAGLAQGLDLKTIRRGVEECEAVPGRFEPIREGQPFLVVVDYAHTDDALRNVLESARALRSPGGRIITVFGCGGDRDRAKRPLMGEVAGRLSDRVILTSDNPRSEDPLRIIADAEVGLQRLESDYVRELDRRAAIERAVREAGTSDIVLIAGKGHETTQKIGAETLPFDDREVAREALRGIQRGRRVG